MASRQGASCRGGVALLTLVCLLSVALSASSAQLALLEAMQQREGRDLVRVSRCCATLAQQAYVKASNTFSGNFMGSSASLSADGNTLAVGATGESGGSTGVGGVEVQGAATSSGAVYVFTRSGTVWTQQAYVKASNTAPNNFFGHSVALSIDGNTMAVSAFQEGSNATGIGGSEMQGGATNAGAVYVFTRVGQVWTQQAYVKASNTDANNLFGTSVALSSNGSTMAVGAIFESGGATGVGGSQVQGGSAASGAVYMFTRTGAVWTQQAYVKASNTASGNAFGVSVALSSDGSTLAVGAYLEASSSTGVGGSQTQGGAANAGAVYVFARTGTVWSQVAYVKASNTATGNNFGRVVALSSDGNTLAVAAPAESSNAIGIGGSQVQGLANSSGAVYVFARGPSWSQQAYVKASNTLANNAFGFSVALSSNGSTMAIGAHHESSGATGVGGSQTQQAGGTGSQSGAVYVFTRNNGGAVWTQQAYVKASNTASSNKFGYSTTLSSDGSTLAVGAHGEGSTSTGVNGSQGQGAALQSGAVYVFSSAAATTAPVTTFATTTSPPSANACGSLPNCTCAGLSCVSAVPVASNASLNVSTASTLTVLGSVTLAPTATLVVSIVSPPTGAVTTSTSVATVNGTLQLVIGNVPSGTVTVVQAASVVGTFASVVTTSSSACGTATSSAPMYSPTTITVAFQTSNTCSSTGLSTGAIAGIVVGGVFGLALVASIVGVALRRRYLQSEMQHVKGRIDAATEMQRK